MFVCQRIGADVLIDTCISKQGWGHENPCFGLIRKKLSEWNEHGVFERDVMSIQLTNEHL